MKLLCGFLMIAFAVSDVWTLPARNNPQDDAEVIAVPQARPEPIDPTFHDFKGVIDTGAEHPFLQPNPSGFRLNLGFANSFEDIFRRLHARLWPLVRDTDESVDGTAADDSSEAITPLGFGLRPLTAVNTKNGNTTSTVKVVNGHKVEINETVYGDTNSLFKVRLVNVRPLESGEEVAEGVINNQGDFKPVDAPSTSAPPKRTELDDLEDEDERREPLEKQPRENEVRGDIDEPQRTTSTTTTTTTKATNTSTSTLASSSPLEDSLADSTDVKQTVHTIMADLMGDVQQQQEQEQELELEQLAEPAQDAGTMAHNEETEMPLPDSDSHNAAEPESLAAIENFGVETDSDLAEPQSQSQSAQLHREREELESSDDEGDAAPIEMSDTFNDEWAELDAEAAAVDPSNDLNNDIDIYENLAPVDLSNDIAVNDVAAANPNYPQNPDAELIELPADVETMPKFEKLSLTPPTPLMK